MARPLRFEYPGAIYHVMNRGSNKAPIFIEPRIDRFLFFDVLSESVQKWKIVVHAFSLMPNHYHLLIETPLGNLSRAMRHIDGIFTQKLNKRHNRDGPLFRGRFKSILVQEETYFLELVRYIHMNSVKAQIYSKPEEDPFSSHRFYLDHRRIIPWLCTTKVLSYFQSNHRDIRRVLDQFVQKAPTGKLDHLLSRQRWPVILGTDSFVNQIKNKFNLSDPLKNQQEVPQLREIQKTQRIPSAKLFEEIEAVYEEPVSKDIQREKKWATMYLLQKEAHWTNRAIAEKLGGVTEGAIRKKLSRSSYRHSKKFQKLLSRLGIKMSDVRT